MHQSAAVLRAECGVNAAGRSRPAIATVRVASAMRRGVIHEVRREGGGYPRGSFHAGACARAVVDAIDSDHVRILEAAARLGSLTAAALALGRSQPWVSRRLRRTGFGRGGADAVIEAADDAEGAPEPARRGPLNAASRLRGRRSPLSRLRYGFCHTGGERAAGAPCGGSRRRCPSAGPRSWACSLRG
jgi:hypothetical protein